ncbi:hypothetical protein CR513_17888, partial [Mucuna pruriens]
MYLSHIRPDIAYVVSINSSKRHIEVVIRILRYLKFTPGRGIMFSKNNHLNVEGYTNADWVGFIVDRKSTLGYLTFVGSDLVTWISKKQKVIVLSRAKVEFQGMSKRLCKLLWATIEIAHNFVQHDCTKHIDIDRHFIKQNLVEKIIKFSFVQSKDQLVDTLTKIVSSKVFHNSLNKFGIKDIYAPT